MGSPQLPPRHTALPTVRRAVASAAFIGIGVGGWAGAAPGQLRPRVTAHAYSHINVRTPTAEFSF